jgi:flavin reductase
MSQPIDQVETLASVSPADFKAAMRRFASTVNVITSGCGGVLNGMTATAVCSVSVEPPSILIVVNQSNRSHALIQQSGAYTVNVLADSQQHLAAHFAASSTAPFAAVPHSLGLNKCPIIDDCASFLACVVESRMRSGTHSVFIGRVVASGESHRLPLIYHDGKFRC